MKRFVLFIPALLMSGVGIFFVACTQQPKEESKTEVTSTDPLPSWNDGATKKGIVDFITAVTTQGNPKFIPIEERIATFDNDGTLWCEQPLYFEFLYSMAATQQIGNTQHALITKPELKALVAGDMETFLKSGEEGMLEVFSISHTAVSIDEFDTSAKMWLDTTVHKRFGRKYMELTYKPMRELLNYLRANQFKTFIVSGGSSMFVRTFSEQAYGIPPNQVVGTMFKSEFVQKQLSYNIVLKPEVFYLDDNVGKPIAIYQFIGRKPILAFGNSDGDLEMLQWTSSNSRPNLSLILHHTDSVREYAYDRQSQIGKLDKALDEGKAKGWLIVNMKEDWNKIFSFEK